MTTSWESHFCGHPPSLEHVFPNLIYPSVFCFVFSISSATEWIIYRDYGMRGRAANILPTKSSLGLPPFPGAFPGKKVYGFRQCFLGKRNRRWKLTREVQTRGLFRGCGEKGRHTLWVRAWEILNQRNQGHSEKKGMVVYFCKEFKFKFLGAHPVLGRADPA